MVDINEPTDFELAMWFLCGARPGMVIVWPDSPAPCVWIDYEPSYPKGSDEKKACKAVSRLLLTGDTAERQHVLGVLASLFDPDKPTHSLAQKIVELRYRAEGAPPKKQHRNDAIWRAIKDLHKDGLSYEKAYEQTATEHELSVSRVKNIFLACRKGG